MSLVLCDPLSFLYQGSHDLWCDDTTDLRKCLLCNKCGDHSEKVKNLFVYISNSYAVIIERWSAYSLWDW